MDQPPPDLISFVLPARNARNWTERALYTIAHSIDALQWREKVQCILLDDNSDPAIGILPVFTKFRDQSGLPTRIVRFKQRQHYSRCFAIGLSLAEGQKIFFLSNDMVFTPAFFTTLWDISSADPTIGIVRGTSNHTDSHPEHRVLPPFPLRSYADVLLFSQFAAMYWKKECTADRLLSGDAVLINRALIDAIGVIDSRFFGYFGDIDYGLRTLRAGFKLICAKGAWLFHEGAGYIKDQAALTQTDRESVFNQRMETVQKTYQAFRDKWDRDLPEKYADAPSLAFPHLATRQPLDFNRYIPPLTLTPDIGESL